MLLSLSWLFFSDFPLQLRFNCLKKTFIERKTVASLSRQTNEKLFQTRSKKRKKAIQDKKWSRISFWEKLIEKKRRSFRRKKVDHSKIIIMYWMHACDNGIHVLNTLNTICCIYWMLSRKKISCFEFVCIEFVMCWIHSCLEWKMYWRLLCIKCIRVLKTFVNLMNEIKMLIIIQS